MSQATPEVYRTAAAPFNSISDADIVVRSKTSKVDFFVFKAFLAFASPVFKTMLSLPQGNVAQDPLPTVDLEEEEATLDLLLRYCYPCWIDKTTEPGLETLVRALKASLKYDMAGVERQLRGELVAPRFLKQEPLQLYAVALHHQLEAEARMAAKETLRLPILGRPYIDELEWITAGSHLRLQEYHLRCAELAGGVAWNLEWVTADKVVWFECTTECRGQNSQAVKISGGRVKYVMTKWWTEYLAQAGVALGECPAGATVMQPDLMDEVLGKAGKCTGCRARAFKELRAFAEEFAAEVDRVTAAVVLEIRP